MEEVYWTVVWWEGERKKECGCFSKRAAILKYLELLFASNCRVSDVKIFRGDEDYTETLNKFLSR